ncbi:glycerophosphoryl diester phosphodiesterase membrane domain-containing protein [Sphingobium ummariense]
MSDNLQPLAIGEILSAAARDIGANIIRYGGLVIAAGVIGGLGDTYLPPVGNLASNIMIFVISVLATWYTLQAKLADDEIRPRFGAAFGLNLLANLGIGFGLLLLIVPGLILYTRWAVGLPALIRENLSVSEALGRSSNLTEGNRWRVLGLGLLIWVPFFLILILLGGLTSAFAGDEMLDTAAFNILLNLTAAGIATLSAICWTEAYLSLSGEEQGSALAQVFA